MFDGRQLYFLTLTYRRFISPELAWGSYNHAWNRLRTNMVKQFGKFSFVRVLESHNKTPYPHLHVIVDKGFRPHQFGPAAVHAGFGYQLKIQPITGDGARGYITKYITKKWRNEEGWRLRKLNRCRIVSFSRDLRQEPLPRVKWDMLDFGKSYDECRDAINRSIDWDPEHEYTMVGYRETESTVMIEYDVVSLPVGFYERRDPWDYPD
jgi:hypothetical protein